MGITRRFEELRPLRIEDNFNYNDFDLAESDHEHEVHHDNSVIVPDSPSRTKKNKEKRADKRYHHMKSTSLNSLFDRMRRFFEHVDNDGGNIKNNMGARKWRRVENGMYLTDLRDEILGLARMLLSLTDKDDVCIDYSDTVLHTVSAFEKLFIERESMEAWNEFIAKDEEQQREILATGKWTQEETKGWFVVGGKSTPRKPKHEEDKRAHHPAYSAEACFERLERKSKQLLQRKHLPWGFLAYTEKQLRDFFTMDSSAVYVGHFDNAIDRAVVHAVAQFLFLKSKSTTEKDTNVRVTEIRNTRAFFIPPHTDLMTYLSQVRGEPIDYVPFDGMEEDISSDSSFCAVDSDSAQYDCGDQLNQLDAKVNELTIAF